MRGRDADSIAAGGQTTSGDLLRPRVDQIWRFDLLPSLCLGTLVLLGVLFYVWQHIHVVRLGYEIEQLQAERAALLRQQKELRFDVARLKSLRRVEEIARRQLGLTSPTPGQMILVE